MKVLLKLFVGLPSWFSELYNTFCVSVVSNFKAQLSEMAFWGSYRKVWPKSYSAHARLKISKFWRQRRFVKLLGLVRRKLRPPNSGDIETLTNNYIFCSFLKLKILLLRPFEKLGGTLYSGVSFFYFLFSTENKESQIIIG